MDHAPGNDIALLGSQLDGFAPLKFAEESSFEREKEFVFVVGLVLMDRKSVPEVFAVCTPEDFFHNPHPRIMEVCKALHDDGMKVTPLTVKTKLGSALGEIGDLDYLAGLAKAAPMAPPLRDGREAAFANVVDTVAVEIA